jgi:hypothetical protein
MTGFVFLSQILFHPDISSTSKNRLYVMGKPRPLLIEKSSFAKTSAGHEATKARRKVDYSSLYQSHKK